MEGLREGLRAEYASRQNSTCFHEEGCSSTTTANTAAMFQ